MGARYAIWRSQTIRQIAATGLRRVRSCTINGAPAVKSKSPPSRPHPGRRDARGPEPAARDCFVTTLLAMTLPFLSLRAERSNLVPPIGPAQQKAPVHAVPPA